MAAKSYLEQIFVPRGEVVFREGEPGHCAYLIERGAIEIVVERGGKSMVLARRTAGEIFGEMAIIGDEPRSATVRAVEDCALLLITPEQVNRRLEYADPILRMCLSVVLARFRSTLRRLQTIEAEAEPVASDLAAAHRKAAGLSYDQVIEEIKLEKELEAAITREDMELHYQPIVDLRSDSIAGFEALVRWRHAERGLVLPGAFIPTAEASGLITPLSRWCFRAACAALVRFDRYGRDSRGQLPMFVSVNVSARDVEDASFIEHIERVLAETRVDPQRIKLEVTESVLMRQPERSIAALDRCKMQGLSICIDDFGTGYSSLSYLHRLPVDTLKLDRSFVTSMRENAQSMEIVKTIKVLADQLQIPIVAEGIEAEADAAVLRRLGYPFGQGYHFARPMPEGQAVKLIQSWPAGVQADKQVVRAL
jgi:EAL domain-containing protein (putative c-di-GMP-specific phosphodiesterase class I)